MSKEISVSKIWDLLQKFITVVSTAILAVVTGMGFRLLDRLDTIETDQHTLSDRLTVLEASRFKREDGEAMETRITSGMDKLQDKLEERIISLKVDDQVYARIGRQDGRIQFLEKELVL